MMLISFLIMYLVMFLNMDILSHYHTSMTRVYMALLMVAPMAIVMMIMMCKMYPDKKANTGIIIGSAIIFALILAAYDPKHPSAISST